MTPVWGWPWHGLCQGGQITLPNAATKTYGQPATGDTHLVQVPGLITPPRSAAEQAADTAAGRQWLNYAMLAGSNHRLYNTDIGANRWLFVAADKSVWLIEITVGTYINPNVTIAAKYRRFGRFPAAGDAWVSFAAVVDTGALTQQFIGNAPVAISSSGDRAIIAVTDFLGNIYSLLQITLTLSGGVPAMAASVFRTESQCNDTTLETSPLHGGSEDWTEALNYTISIHPGTSIGTCSIATFSGGFIPGDNPSGNYSNMLCHVTHGPNNDAPSQEGKEQRVIGVIFNAASGDFEVVSVKYVLDVRYISTAAGSASGSMSGDDHLDPAHTDTVSRTQHLTYTKTRTDINRQRIALYIGAAQRDASELLMTTVTQWDGTFAPGGGSDVHMDESISVNRTIAIDGAVLQTDTGTDTYSGNAPGQQPPYFFPVMGYGSLLPQQDQGNEWLLFVNGRRCFGWRWMFGGHAGAAVAVAYTNNLFGLVTRLGPSDGNAIQVKARGVFASQGSETSVLSLSVSGPAYAYTLPAELYGSYQPQTHAIVRNSAVPVCWV